jgi:DNA helicase II / ATP-dependent DNA helicase PcrA
VVEILQFPSSDKESDGVAQHIVDRHRSGCGPIAVIARSRKLLEPVEGALRRAGVPAVIAQRKDEFASTPFVWLHSMLRLANDRQSESSLQAVCGTFRQLTGAEVDAEEAAARADAGNGDLLQHWTKLARSLAQTEGGIEAVEATERFLGEGRDPRGFSTFALGWFARLLPCRMESDADPFIEVFAGYEEERCVWSQLTRDITLALGGEPTLEAFLQELQMRSKESVPGPNTVVLMTIHGAKGKEFQHVYLIGLVEDELPSFQSKRSGDKSPEMEEERRNCFVAITRTMKTLTLSYARMYRGWAKEPSRFLAEMGVVEPELSGLKTA